jgi:hypothetical protein
MPRNTRSATSVATPVFVRSATPEPPWTAEAAVVEKLTLAVVLVVGEFSVIGEPGTEQMGKSTAPAGEEVSEQARVMLPE